MVRIHDVAASASLCAGKNRLPQRVRPDRSGANIRRRDHTGELWKVEFQNKVRGLQVLTVTWDQPRPATTNLLELTGVSADGVERETGILAIVARAVLSTRASHRGR